MEFILLIITVLFLIEFINTYKKILYNDKLNSNIFAIIIFTIITFLILAITFLFIFKFIKTI